MKFHKNEDFELILMAIRDEFNKQCDRYHLARPLIQLHYTMGFAISSDCCDIDYFSFDLDRHNLQVQPVSRLLVTHNSKYPYKTYYKYKWKEFDMADPEFDVKVVVKYLLRKIKYKSSKVPVKRTWFGD